MSWYEDSGRAIAEEFSLEEGSKIEHQLGTVWIDDKDGTTTAISALGCESINTDQAEVI